MNKRFIALISAFAALCAALFCCACASPANTVTDEQAMGQIRRSYRDSSLIISGECVQFHMNADDQPCADIMIDEVIAGSADVGDTVHCLSADMFVSEKYMLYLKSAADVDRAEDDASYNIVEALRIEGGAVAVSGVSMDVATLKRDIRALSGVISAPGSYYYYSDLASLALAADEIFIGKVTRQPGLTDTEFRVSENGSTVEYTIPASVATVTAYGSIKGRLAYDDTVKLVYAPAACADLVDAATLTAVSYTETNAPNLKQDGLYIFFLTKSPDEKQEHCFCINPIQGYVPIAADDLFVPGVNSALQSYVQLRDLVSDIKSDLS